MVQKQTVYSMPDVPELYRYRPSPSSPWVNYPSISGLTDVKQVETNETASFQRLCRLGEFLPLHPFRVSHSKNEFIPGFFDWWIERKSNNQELARGNGNWSGTYARLTLPPPDQSIIDQVVSTSLAKAGTPDWDVLTFLAELKQSAGTVMELARAFNHATLQIATEARAFKRNPYKRFRELWLGNRFGVRPIVYDFIGASSAVRRTYESGLPKLFKGRAKEVDQGSATATDVTVENSMTSYTVNSTLTWERTYRGWAAVDLSLAEKAFGFQPMITAWELVPYSWIVDRFIDIGSWIQSLTVALSGDLLGVCYSIKTEFTEVQTRNATWVDSPTQRAMGTHCSGLRNTWSTQEYIRQPVVYPPVLPSMKVDLTPLVLIDIASALIKGRNAVMNRLGSRGN